MRSLRGVCVFAMLVNGLVCSVLAQTNFQPLAGPPRLPNSSVRPLRERFGMGIGNLRAVGDPLLPSSGASPVFFEAPTDPTDLDPAYVAAGDVNGDGNVDLVTANAIGNSVSVLLNAGGGAFQPHVDYAVEVEPYSLVLADLNGDGKLDIAVASLCGTDSSCLSPGTISILLGNGDGTFQPQISYAAGNEPYSIAAGDFNGDGNLDLAVSDRNCFTETCGLGSIAVFLGNGDGSFQTAVQYAVPQYSPASISLSDFNRDGKLDMAVLNVCGDDANCQNATSGSISIFLGNGNGTFQSPKQHVTPPYPESVTVADFNGDGVPDLATAGQFTSSVMSIFLGNGDGTFQPFVNYPAIDTPLQLVAGDFNQDGKMDLAEAGEGGVGIHLGNGDGSFRPVVSYVTGFNESAAIADLNGDGIPDLATANPYDDVVSTLFGYGNGSLQSSRTYEMGRYFAPYFASAGNFNSDQVPDFAVADGGDGAADLGGVSVFLGQGGGTFSAAVTYAAGANPWSIAVGDFNGDGKTDIVVGDNNYQNPLNAAIGVLLGNGNGTFETPIEISSGGYYPQTLAVGDFNGDGKLDLAVSNQQAAAPNYHGNLLLFLGSGNGTFQSPVTLINDTYANQLVAADFNGDGKLDLAGTFGVNLIVFLGNGNGTFQSPANYSVEWNQAGLVAADFNHDGVLDLATSGTNYLSQSVQGEVTVFLGNGDGTFRSPTSYASSFYAGWLVSGDFNVDGDTELADYHW